MQRMSENGNYRWRNELVRIGAAMSVLLTSAAIDAGAIEVLPKCMNDLLKCGIFVWWGYYLFA